MPPINIVERPNYKKKPKPEQKIKPRHWEMREFKHGARDDGLVLRHWKRAVPLAVRGPVVTRDGEMEVEEEPALMEIKFEEEFPSDKWNVKVDVPTYTDEQYENDFKSDDWTKEETNYLLDLCRDFDLRWLLIADRYEPADIGDEPYPARSMEDMKLRYYTIAAKVMESHTPASNMTAVEFQLWEKMKGFDAKTETQRKTMAEKLFERTKDEADEERILLEELHRITKNEEDFIKLRRDLYSRLESAPPIRRTERGEEQSTAAYQTSAGLTALLQTLLAKERKLKRPLPNGEQPQQTPVDRRGQPNQYSRRDTLDSQTDGPQKKGSTSQANVRALTAAEQVKYGVSHPQERLTSGIQFRHQKIDRLTMAKSQVQTSKIQAALAQLGIPNRLLMPTERVCREFERLVESIHKLLDIRKAHEKTTNEIKVLEEMRRIRLGLPKSGESGDVMNVDTSQIEPESSAVNESTIVDQDADGEDEDAEGEKDDTVEESAMQVDEQGEDDAEGEDDEDAGDKSAIAEDDDEEVDQSFGDLGKDVDGEEEDEDEEAEVAQDSDEDGEDVDAVPEGDEDDEAQVNGSEAGEEEDDEDEEEEQGDDGEEEEDAEAEVEPSELEPSRPSSSSHSAAVRNKRSASVISDASKAGSNRSGLGRKKRR